MISKAHDEWGIFPKCGAKLGYCLGARPLILRMPFTLGLYPFTKHPTEI
jgi:hypothetical protein